MLQIIQNMMFSERLEFELSTVGAKIIRTPRVFPLNPIVNKSCKIECCDKKLHQTIQNMILSRGLELKLSLL